MTNRRIMTRHIHEQLSRTAPGTVVQLQSNVLGPKRETKVLIKAFRAADDIFHQYVSLSMVDIKLHWGEEVNHARYRGNVSPWKAWRWERWEMLIIGPSAFVQDFYRAVEAIYERP